MTETIDYPDFVRPVAQAESDTVLHAYSVLAGNAQYSFGPFDVSQAAMVRGIFYASLASGDIANLTFLWSNGTDYVAQDDLTFPAMIDVVNEAQNCFGIKPKGTLLTVILHVVHATNTPGFGLYASTRAGDSRELYNVNGVGRVLADTGTQPIGAGATVNLVTQPVARAVALRGRVNGPNGVITLGVNYGGVIGPYGLAIVFRQALTSGADVNEIIEVPPLALTVGVQNLDTAAHSYNVSLVDVS